MRPAHTLAAAALALSSLGCLAADGGEIYDPKGESASTGFVDIDLHIDSMACDSWAACDLSASGSFRGRPVAIGVAVRVQGGQGRITYRSVGAASDALVQALATLYKSPRNDMGFASAAGADIVILDADAHKMAGKVFFAANGPESDYAELYTNVDRRRRVLEIREKDTEYRANVLKGLSK